MQTPDDRQFESYLKEFRPIAPDPLLRSETLNRPLQTSRPWRAILSTAAIATLGVIALWVQVRPVAVPQQERVVVLTPAPSEPLTLRDANIRLSNAPSFEDALNELAFRSGPKTFERGKQSVVAVLSEERIQQ